MKQKLLKITALQQVIIIIALSFLSLFTIASKMVVAEEINYNQVAIATRLKSRVNNQIRKRKGLGGLIGSCLYDCGVYVDNQAINNGAAWETAGYTGPDSGYLSGGNTIVLDLGTAFTIVPTDWAKRLESITNVNNNHGTETIIPDLTSLYKVADYSFSIYAFSYIDGTKLIRTVKPLESVIIKEDEIKDFFDYSLGESKRAVIKVEVTKNGKRESLDDIEINIIKPEIKVSSESGNVAPSAFIKDNKLYVQPNSNVILTNTFKRDRKKGNTGYGTYSLEGSGTGYSITSGGALSTPGKLGQTAKIKYRNQCGATAYLDVVTSNLSTGDFKISYYKNALFGETTRYGYSDYATALGVEFGKEVQIKIQPKKQVNGANVKLTGVEVKDIGGCFDGNHTIKLSESDSTFDIRFKVKKAGFISITLKNYNNRDVTKYYYIKEGGPNSIVYEPVESKKTTVPSNPGTSTQPSNPGTSTQPSNPGTSTQPSNPGTSTQPSNPGTSTQQPTQTQQPKTTITYKQPTIKIQSSRDGNQVKYTVSVSGTNGVKYKLQKRTNESVCNVKDNNYDGFSGSKPYQNSSFIATYKIDSVDNGLYDFIVYAKNGPAWSWSAVGPIKMGKDAAYKNPIVTLESSEINDQTGLYTGKFTTSNCTELKYKFIKRTNTTSAYTFSSKLTYDAFDGKKVSNAKQFSLNLNPCENGAGTYDLAIWGINNDKSIACKTIIPGIKVSVAPNSVIQLNQTSTISKKIYNVGVYSIDKDNISKIYYYVAKKDNSTETKEYTREFIEEKGVKVDNNSFQVEINAEKTGDGYYDIVLYAEDEFEKGRIMYQPNIYVENPLKINYTIEGEKENAQGTIVSRDKQVVNINVEDAAEVKYKIDEKSDLEINEELFNDATKLQLNNNTGKVIVNATPSKETNKYVYLKATSKNGISTYKRTGSLSVDGTNLKLESIHAEKDNNDTKTVYCKDSVIKIAFEFNHKMSENYPDVYIKVKENNYTVKQNKAIVKDNRVTYYYNVTSNFGEGSLEIARIDYTNKSFKDAYSTPGEYKTALTNISKTLNEFDNKFTVDAVAPVVTSYEIHIDTNENSTVQNGEKIVIKNPASVKAVLKYSENVVDYGTLLGFIKGNKHSFWADSDEDKERNTDIYEIDVNSNEFKKYEGDLKLSNLFLATIWTQDINGNELELSDVEGPVFGNPVYILNGTKVEGKEIIFDDSVYKPEIYVGSQSIEDNVTYNVGTEFTAFKEFAEIEGDFNENCYDISGVQTVRFNISYNDENSVQVLDKNGNGVTCETDSLYRDKYQKIASYNIQKDKLPLKFVISNKGDYRIGAEKQDGIGNKELLYCDIKVDNLVTIDKENSGLTNVDKNNPVRFENLTKEQKNYVLKLNIDTENVNTENVKVYVKDRDNFAGEQETEATGKVNTTYNYKFPTYKAGRYDVKVIEETEEDSKVLLNDYVLVNNTFILGDVNADGLVNVCDLQEILCYLAGLHNYITDETHFELTADVDGDGRIMIADAILMAQFISETPGAHFVTKGE